MDVLASTFLVEVTVLLKPADSLRFLVLMFDCNVKKIVEQDLRTKHIVNFTCFFFLCGWSTVVNSHCLYVEGGSSKPLIIEL